MKVLHILSTRSFSGAENVACQIIGAFADSSEYDMVYASPDGAIRDSLLVRNIKFEPMENMSLGEVKRVIKCVSPDIVHAHDYRAAMLASFAVGNKKLIIQIHNNYEDARKLSSRSISLLVSSFRAKHIFWVSDSCLNEFYFSKQLSKKSSVLKNIVNVDDIRSRAIFCNKIEPYDIVYVGRLDYQKNPQRLIGVMAKILNKVDCKIAIVGDGEYRQEVEQLSKEYGINKKISFLGFVNNPIPIVSNSKLMLMTSRWEGTPMCVLEALVLGVPVVATKVDGMLELSKQYDGLYLSDEDDELVDNSLKLLATNEILSERIKDGANRHNDIFAYRSKIEKEYVK